MPSMHIQGREIPYTLRQSQRAKRISIRHKPGQGFELVYPRSQSAAAALDFFREKQRWVLKTWEKAGAKVQPARVYGDAAELPYLGGGITLRLADDGDDAYFVFEGDQLKIVLSRRYHADQGLLRQVVESFYRQQAKRYLPQRLTALARQHGFAYKALRIKNQKTRWGSCSAKGNINLNLRLMMAPPAAIDYVILHELCHTRELNHGAAFWAQVARCCPGYQRWIDWFKANGARLTL